MSLRYRLYPTPAQEQVMRMHCDHARFVWNLALEQDKHARAMGQYADQFAWERQLAEVRQSTWLGEGSSHVQQQALRDLRQAYRNWWGNPSFFRPPTWRSKNGAQGFRVVNLKVRQLSRGWGEVLVPKAGRVKFRLSRPLGDHRSARVTLDRSGRWHVALTSPQPPVDRVSTGAMVGVDLGITNTIATSDGQLLNCPVPSRREVSRKRRLQRKMERQQAGSKRREVTKRAIAKLAAREADRRKDWVEKTSTQLVRGYDLIVFEDLKVKQMMRSATGTVEVPGRSVAQKAGLNRSIGSQGWSMIRTRTEQKAAAAVVPCHVLAVSPVGTSQNCSRCGSRGLRRGKHFDCACCGRSGDADVNAAENILAAGLAVTGRGGVGAIRPPDEASTIKQEVTP